MTAQPASPSDGSDRPVASVPWSGGVAVLDVLVIYGAAQVLAAAVALLLSGLDDDPDALLPLLIALSPVGSLIATLLWLRLRYGSHLRAIMGKRSPRLSDVGIGVAVGLLCLLGQRIIVLGIAAVAEGFGAELPVVQETFRTIAQRPGAVPLFVVTTVVLAPLAEEVLFRGVLFQGLRQKTGFWVAALVSAVLFTLPHLAEGGGAIATGVISSGILPLGVVFAALVERRGSLAPAIFAHATYNAIGVAVLILLPGQA